MPISYYHVYANKEMPIVREKEKRGHEEIVFA